ncbi:MAG: hypothetical protein J6B24_07805 [Clostridia bacterium]|nr:hypothetical protein [Clostridia bacterium]
MKSITTLKTVNGNFEVEYEVLSPISVSNNMDQSSREALLALQDVNKQIEICENEIAKLDSEIDRLTNQADGWDYAISVISGILTGLIDSFFVGETEIDIEKIQKELEKKYHASHDHAFTHKSKDGHNISSPLYHRLDDLAHHPSLLGLAASILARYLRLVVFIDGTDGKPHVFFADVPTNSKTWQLEKEQLQKAWIGAIIGGLCVWLADVAVKKDSNELPDPLKKMIKTIAAVPLTIEILKAADSWLGHMMSDVSTSQGIPGLFLSLLKEISVLPFLRNTNLRVYVDGLYNKGNHNLWEYSSVIFTAAKKQAMPILINEAIVRGFYFVRSLIIEYKKSHSFQNVNWQNVIPFGNRTIERMMTIASGTFMAVDIADAAIRGAINSGGTWVGFAKEFVLRINFVGVGRFVIAIGVDTGMGIKRNKLRNERMIVYSELLALSNAKTFYMEENMWKTAIDTGKTLERTMQIAEESVAYCAKEWSEIECDLESILPVISEIADNDADLAQDLLDVLDY